MIDSRLLILILFFEMESTCISLYVLTINIMVGVKYSMGIHSSD